MSKSERPMITRILIHLLQLRDIKSQTLTLRNFSDFFLLRDLYQRLLYRQQELCPENKKRHVLGSLYKSALQSMRSPRFDQAIRQTRVLLFEEKRKV
jgi:hypothetical protein